MKRLLEHQAFIIALQTDIRLQAVGVDVLRYGTFTALDTLIIGGWFVIIGYFFLLAVYFFYFRFRESRNLFHLGFGFFFLLLGVARAFFLAYDFYELNVSWWKLGTAFSWMAIFAIFLGLVYQILGDHRLQVLTSLPPIVIAVLVLVLPPEMVYPNPALPSVPLGYTAFNYVILPLYTIVLPLLFFYIGIHLAGPLRTSNFLIGGGFVVYYSGRVLQASPVSAFLDSLVPQLGISDIIAPVLVFVALVLIAMGVLKEKHE